MLAFILTIVALVLLAWSVSIFAGQAQPNPPAQKPAVTAQEVGKLSKSEIRDRLQHLTRMQSFQPKMGAMCYAPAPPPDRVEYVCPRCGEKTIYSGKSFNVFWAILQMDDCRRKARQLKILSKEAVVVDETAYCRKCTPGTNAPALRVTTTFADETHHTVSTQGTGDLDILVSFFSSSVVFKTSNDGEVPMKDLLPRLQELLGVKLDAKP